MRYEEYAGVGSDGVPKVGDKCTMHLFSDANPCQVVRVSASGKTIWIKENATEHDKSKEGVHVPCVIWKSIMRKMPRQNTNSIRRRTFLLSLKVLLQM